MIETTLRTAFVPGTNVRGKVTGANWAFLLPSLELEHAICIGAPPSAAMRMLARIANRVTVVAEGEGARRVQLWASTHDASHVSVTARDVLAVVPPAELVWVIDADGPPVDGLVAPGGSIYEERRGRAGELALHLTPFGGEMRTAVPLADTATINWFVRHGLHCRTVNVHTLKDLFGRKGRSESTSRGAGATGASKTGDAKKGGARAIGNTVLGAAGAAERFMLGQPWLRGQLGRQATLILPEGEGARPPRWLREIADGFGVDLGGCRWGLAANGQYSSRKVLFFLWDADAPAEASPRWVVKLTRDPALNGRLENLARALEALHRIPEIDERSVPRAAFHGHHAGLAVVGEGVVDGGPFAGRSAWNAECGVAANAVEWLTNLAAATAFPAPPTEVAGALRRLFEDFAGIYDLRADEHAFLKDQLDAVEQSAASFPLVFQHGDSGTWNLFANRAGRVAFLDWEAAEPDGIPLWDLFYFLRSFAVGCAQNGGTHDRLTAIEATMFADAPHGRMLVDAVERYRERTGLDPVFVEPLFHTCWMHRALKEATRLTPDQLPGGHYFAMMRLGIARRGAPTLRRLFGS
jgi:aminoglycoside phosphotransferase (APT) family kinase protein